MTATASAARDALDDKVNQVFSGKCARKDLVRAIKVDVNVPVFVLEYLLGTDPSASDSTPVQVTAPGQQLQLQFRLPIGIAGVTPTVEVTNDLTQWQTGPGHTEIVSDSSSSGFRTLIIRDAVPGPQRFIRLRVTR